MQRLITPTLTIVIAGSITAGIALARPAEPSPADPSVAATPSHQPATDAASDHSEQTPTAPAGGFLGENAVADRGFLAGDSASAGGDQPQSVGTPAQATPAVIEISGFAFGDTLTVAPGQTVDVSNLDGAPHTITADDVAFDTGTISGGEAARFTAPTDPGTYTFFCAIHPSMRGELIVQS